MMFYTFTRKGHDGGVMMDLSEYPKKFQWLINFMGKINPGYEPVFTMCERCNQLFLEPVIFEGDICKVCYYTGKREAK